MVNLLGDVRLALPNKVVILDKLSKVSAFLGKIADVAVDNVELAEAVSEVSISVFSSTYNALNQKLSLAVLRKL